MTVALALAAGAAVGVVLGLLGAGGSLLTAPALIFLLAMSAHEATGTSLVVVAAMATAGLVVHRRAGRCACRPGLQFAAAGVVTSAVAGWLAGDLPEWLVSTAFAVLLAVTAGWFLVRAARRGPGKDPTDIAADAGSRHDHEGVRTGHVAGAGAGVGVLTGILGVGGGFVVVPALIATLGLSAELAAGTSQLVILTNALAALAGRSLGTNTVVWSTGSAFAAGGVVGAVVGSRLTGRFSGRTLQVTFAVLAAVVSVAMVVTGGGT